MLAHAIGRWMYWFSCSASSPLHLASRHLGSSSAAAFSIDATGYTAGEPTGRYFAPPNTAQCLEIASTSNTNWNAGYGDCGEGSVVVTGPKVIRWDFNIVKQIPMKGRLRFEFQWQIFNVFNNVNFTPVNLSTSSANMAVLDNYQVTGAVDQSRTGQMAFRISW